MNFLVPCPSCDAWLRIPQGWDVWRCPHCGESVVKTLAAALVSGENQGVGDGVGTGPLHTDAVGGCDDMTTPTTNRTTIAVPVPR
jgi:hypothetical protein